jgi:hypothetical protein
VQKGLTVGADSANSVHPTRWFWRLACLLVLMLLVILEPLVTFTFAALALLGLLTTLFFHLIGPPDFPRWTMLALSLGFALALVPYHAPIRKLSNACKCDAASLYASSRNPQAFAQRRRIWQSIIVCAYSDETMDRW